jgi:hypothetical protein
MSRLISQGHGDVSTFPRDGATLRHRTAARDHVGPRSRLRGVRGPRRRSRRDELLGASRSNTEGVVADVLDASIRCHTARCGVSPSKGGAAGPWDPRSRRPRRCTSACSFRRSSDRSRRGSWTSRRRDRASVSSISPAVPASWPEPSRRSSVPRGPSSASTCSRPCSRWPARSPLRTGRPSSGVKGMRRPSICRTPPSIS